MDILIYQNKINPLLYGFSHKMHRTKIRLLTSGSLMFSKLHAAAQQLNEIIVGKPIQIRQALVCILAGGHLLIEDIPGVGKTTLAHALASTLGMQMNRLQFT